MNIAVTFGLIIALGVFALLIVALVFVLKPMVRGIAWAVRHVFACIFGTLGDLLRFVGAVLVLLITAPMAVGCVVIGRWSAAQHYGRAILDELRSMGRSLYMACIGRPARLLCLEQALAGIEQRLPRVIAEAPSADRPAGRTGRFEGYTIVGSLAGGGSGGRLYIAEPDAMKRAAFERGGHRDVDRVVIKSFSLREGSSLPQIVRESRALDAARKLGLVLEHELTPERFYYVTRYVPGQSLGLVTTQLHASSPDGLSGPTLKAALGLIADLLRTLDTYHRGGLWHKDVKPDNIIVETRNGHSRAHLVDFGLVSHLNSAMTLTTHGTEYFRDPEMVRMALRGVKVNEIDGARFDIYGAGAVLYSVIENGFPAHGVLSPVTRRCPEALRWIIRRAMTDYDKRYATVGEMLADLEVVRQAADPFALRPIDLPSVRTGRLEPVAGPEPAGAPVAPAGFGSSVPPPIPGAQSSGGRRTVPPRRPAREQLANARARVRAAQTRAERRRTRTGDIAASTPNMGVFAAVALVGAAVVGLVVLSSAFRRGSGGMSVAVSSGPSRANVPTPSPADAVAPDPVAVTPAVESTSGAITDARALVVVDMPRPLSPAQRASVETALARLRESGFGVLGEFGDGDEALADELTVAARYAAAGAGIDTPACQQSIGEWLATRPDLDLVVWIRRRPDPAATAGLIAGGDQVEWFILRPWGPNVQPERVTRTSALGRSAQHALRAMR
jgi:serine/threonine protein kinase